MKELFVLGSGVGGEEEEYNQKTWVRVSPPQLTGCVASGKILSLSEPKFSSRFSLPTSHSIKRIKKKYRMF